jgi:hypothetical protein
MGQAVTVSHGGGLVAVVIVEKVSYATGGAASTPSRLAMVSTQSQMC